MSQSSPDAGPDASDEASASPDAANPDPASSDAASPAEEPLRTATLTEALNLLRSGELELVGRMPQSSNATFLVKVLNDDGEVAAAAIYKPTKGERPLWDFPAGLHRREIAAFELSDEMGWGVIPPTIERDGPHGVGSVQLFIEANFAQHYFTLVDESEYQADLRTICLFDVVANNTDRKSGHCLLSRWGRIYGIDQGLCFSEDFKLRTVIWDFAGEPLDSDMCKDLHRVMNDPLERMKPWLTEGEIEAMRHRASRLADLGHFPEDSSGRSWPWPLV